MTTAPESGLVAFTVLGVDDNSSKMPLLLAYSPVAQPQAGRANQNPPKGGRVGARKSGINPVQGVSTRTHSARSERMGGSMIRVPIYLHSF